MPRSWKKNERFHSPSMNAPITLQVRDGREHLGRLAVEVLGLGGHAHAEQLDGHDRVAAALALDDLLELPARRPR